MAVGYWCPVLHAHLPYVRHPEHPSFLEEDWLFQALTETYVPIVRVLDGLLRDGVEYRLTMTLSPSLVSMMSDELLVSRYQSRLDGLVVLAGREVDRTAREQPRLRDLARFYLDELSDVRRVFRDVYGADLLSAFRKHRDAGKLEIITSGATHGFLPLMEPVPQAVRGQVQVAARHHRRHFGRDPVGIWLPECAYSPGQDALLREAGLRFSFLETHGLTDADPRPSCGVHAPIVSPGGLVFFGRDLPSSQQVWSARSGYPGDVDYRDFYRDVGWELPLECLQDLPSDGQRRSVGIKYFRVTGRRLAPARKRPYLRARAIAKAELHAADFLLSRTKQSLQLADANGRPPIIVSPFDAELFGHWWYEGPQFLDFLFRKMHSEQDVVKPTTPSEFLERFPELEVCQPPMCAWGAAGYAAGWLNASNDWIYPHLDMAAERMVELARRYDNPNEREGRALNQAARELLLAQSSDWAFIMKTDTAVEYARKRTRDHIARFDHLYRALTHQCMLEEAVLRELEGRDNIFPELDYRVYR